MYFPKEGSLICYIKLIQFSVISENRKTNRKERKSIKKSKLEKMRQTQRILKKLGYLFENHHKA